MVVPDRCDIGYNYLVGGDGNVYEGRAWQKEGQYADRYDNGTLDIAFIGTFTDSPPSDDQMTAYWRLIDVGVTVSDPSTVRGTIFLNP